MTDPTTPPSAAAAATLAADASALAAEGRLWEAADLLMAGFADLGDAADAPESDALGRPIRGSAPPLMDAAAGYLELLDQLESVRDAADAADAGAHGVAADGVPGPAAPPAPPRALRWAQWHTLNGLAEIRRGRPGRAIDHLELASGLFESHGLTAQALPLVGRIVECQLAVDDVPRAEEALHRARALAGRDPAAAARWRTALDGLGRDVAARL